MAENGRFESTHFAQLPRINPITDQSRYWSGFCASWHISDGTRSYRLVADVVSWISSKALNKASSSVELKYLLNTTMSRNVPQKHLDIDWRSVGRRIRELRGFDMNQAQFAHAVGVTQSHVSAIERGQKEIGVVPLFRIARLYGKTIEWLLTGSDREAK
jgi:DNA-binding XRE family transcriptional regulator